MYWTLNTTTSALAPYPTVVCSETGTFLPPCKAPAPHKGLCLNVGAPVTKSYSLVQLYGCVPTPNEAFTFDNKTGLVGTEEGGCLDGLRNTSAAPACTNPPCVAGSDCRSTDPKASQRWSTELITPAAGPPKFRIVHVMDRLCLAAESAAAHARMTLVKCSRGGDATPAAVALQEWTIGPQIKLTSSMSPPNPTCCSFEYVSPSTFGHFAGQKHVAFGGEQGPYSLPITGADTGPLELPHVRTKTLVLRTDTNGIFFHLWKMQTECGITRDKR